MQKEDLITTAIAAAAFAVAALLSPAMGRADTDQSRLTHYTIGLEVGGSPAPRMERHSP